MREVLIWGGSGQIGCAVIQRFKDEGWRVLALSRQSRHDEPGVRWLKGSFEVAGSIPARVDALVSCGPLDAFSHWFERTDLRCDRVVAFGSTSMATKRDSVSLKERAIAEALFAAERRVFARGEARGTPVTMLRPTLVYGAGRDLTLTRIAQLAARWGVFALPRHANGLRQPVHVDDLAQAAVGCLEATRSFGQAYELPGGERLAYREMVKRVLGSLQPPPKLIELPRPVFRAVLNIGQASGRLQGLESAAVQRMQEDLVFETGPAHRDFGYSPRMFQPTAAMFGLR